MNAYTDASVANDYSVHSYVLFDNDKVILQNCEIKNENDTQIAELHSVIMLLTECEKKSIKNIMVHTDNINVATTSDQHKKYGKLIKTMNELLKKTESKIKWVSRKLNKAAHKVCESVKKIINETNNGNVLSINPSDFVLIKKERIYVTNHKIGSISKNSLTDVELNHIRQYYSQMIKAEKRIPIERILEWGSKKKTCNSKKGRIMFVERFIARNHSLNDILFERACHAFNKVSISIV